MQKEKRQQQQPYLILDRKSSVCNSNATFPTLIFALNTRQHDIDVSIAKIASFKRMRDFKDMPLIVEALRESKSLLEVSADGLKVRRKAALVPVNDYHQRSIYAVCIACRWTRYGCFFVVVVENTCLSRRETIAFSVVPHPQEPMD